MKSAQHFLPLYLKFGAKTGLLQHLATFFYAKSNGAWLTCFSYAVLLFVAQGNDLGNEFT